MSGYVYVLTNPSMPGLVKIGSSKFSGSRRASELFTTGVPTPFVLEFEIYCLEPKFTEQSVHDRLSEHRCEGREFFRIDVFEAVHAVAGEALSDWDMFCCDEYPIMAADGCMELAGKLSSNAHPMYLASAIQFIEPEAAEKALKVAEDVAKKKSEDRRGQD